MKERPFIVCQVLSSLDGRISGPFFQMPENKAAQEVFDQSAASYNPEAVLWGKVTAEQVYGLNAVTTKLAKARNQKSYCADKNARYFKVIIDPGCELVFKSAQVSGRGEKIEHIISVLPERAPESYLNYLKKLGISYVFAGEDGSNLKKAVQELRESFGIKRLMVAGGGVIDWSFLQEGLIDELSLIISPVASASRESATIFDESKFTGNRPVAFELIKSEPFKDSVLWLQYRPKNISEN